MSFQKLDLEQSKELLADIENPPEPTEAYILALNNYNGKWEIELPVLDENENRENEVSPTPKQKVICSVLSLICSVLLVPGLIYQDNGLITALDYLLVFGVLVNLIILVAYLDPNIELSSDKF